MFKWRLIEDLIGMQKDQGSKPTDAIIILHTKLSCNLVFMISNVLLNLIPSFEFFSELFAWYNE